MKKWIGFLCVALLVLLGACAAAEGGEPVITPQEWNWNPGKVATFEGSFTLPEPCPETVTLHLAISPEPAQGDPGNIVFTFVNQKRLTVKKQSDAYTLSTEGLESPVSFRGSWFLPDDIYYSSAAVTFSVTTEDGTVLTEKSFRFSEDEGLGQNGDRAIIRLPFQTGQIVLWAGIAAGAVWLAAILRMIFKAMQKKHA